MLMIYEKIRNKYDIIMHNLIFNTNGSKGSRNNKNRI